MKFHYEIMDEHRLEVLKRIIPIARTKADFYLAGGTGLSILMKLRESTDFDFFVNSSFDVHGLINDLKKEFPDLIVGFATDDDLCSIDLNIEGVKVSFFQFYYPIVQPLIKTDIEGLYIASVLDIALMKLNALGGRSLERDYFDLYCIFKYTNIDSIVFLKGFEIKYGKNYDAFFHDMLSLTYFEEIDRYGSQMPKTFLDYEWIAIKRYFVQLQKDMLGTFALTEEGIDPSLIPTATEEEKNRINDFLKCVYDNSIHFNVYIKSQFDVMEEISKLFAARR